MGKKTYIIAQSKGKEYAMRNSGLEGAYHSILNYAKTLISELPDEKSRIVIEVNRKKDPNAYFQLYEFLSTSFYWGIECDLQYRYWVHFAFGNCPYENEIRAKMKFWALEGRSKQEVIKPDFNTFYSKAMKFQSNKFIFHL